MTRCGGLKGEHMDEFTRHQLWFTRWQPHQILQSVKPLQWCWFIMVLQYIDSGVQLFSHILTFSYSAGQTQCNKSVNRFQLHNKYHNQYQYLNQYPISPTSMNQYQYHSGVGCQMFSSTNWTIINLLYLLPYSQCCCHQHQHHGWSWNQLNDESFVIQINL